ncbi:hypothetical protein GIB67_027561, partial [Kingdonia uniflora]
MQFKGREEYGFVEHTRGGTVVAHSVLGKICSLSRSIKPVVPSLTETGARHFVTRFLKSFITMGSLTLLEEGGTVISFGSIDEKTPCKICRESSQSSVLLEDLHAITLCRRLKPNAAFTCFRTLLSTNCNVVLLCNSIHRFKIKGVHPIPGFLLNFLMILGDSDQASTTISTTSSKAVPPATVIGEATKEFGNVLHPSADTS